MAVGANPERVRRNAKSAARFSPENANGLAAKIADELRSLVAGGSIPPGAKLGQIELAEQFAASPVPVREALKLLSSEGIVEHDPNRGFFVAKLSSGEARQLFRMRHLLEDELLQSVVWPNGEQLGELRRRAAELEDVLDAGDRRVWWLSHREFHQMIFDLSPHKVMVREAMRLWTLTDRFRAILPLPKRSSAQRNLVRKHDLVEALAEQDREKLIRLRGERRDFFERMTLEMLHEWNL